MTGTLVIMAAGMGQRFGGPKQLAPVGPSGEALLDYALVDAARAGLGRAAIIIRGELEEPMARHLERHVGSGFPVDLVQQRLDDLPAGAVQPAARTKPWGTGHAVLAARDAVGDDSLVVCNADDWYGAEAFAVAAAHLATQASGPVPAHALVGYRLDETLSPAGGVARGIVRATAAGWMDTIEEVRALRARDGGVEGQLDGRPVRYAGNEPTSMNLWAFHAGILEALRSQFERFLAANAGSPDAEFPLSTAVGEQVARGIARVQVLPTGARWAGMTYASEVSAIRAMLAERVARGEYPADLRRAFA